MIAVESTIRSPSRSRTGNVPRRTKDIARGPPGISDRLSCRIPLWSSAQRAFSLKLEKLYCQRTGSWSLKSLRRQQPPVVRLASIVELELDALGRVALEVAERDRSSFATDDGEDLGSLGEPRHRLRQRRARPAPRDDLLPDEANRVPNDESALG